MPNGMSRNVDVDANDPPGFTGRVNPVVGLPTSARAGASLAVASMLCVQLGLAASVGLFDQIRPEGAAWLRLAWAGVLLLVLVRPRPSAFSRSRPAGLRRARRGDGGGDAAFMAAVARLPLGTASALEFLGPLGVAVRRGRGGRRASGRSSPRSASCC